jgi:hypothetical protein
MKKMERMRIVGCACVAKDHSVVDMSDYDDKR